MHALAIWVRHKDLVQAICLEPSEVVVLESVF